MVVAAVSAALGCCAVLTSYAAPQSVNVTLTASAQNAGKIGQVTLVPHGNATEMLFFIGGVPSGTTMPAHLYTYVYPGSCNQLADKPLYGMTDRTVLGDYVPQQGFKLWRRVPMPFDDLVARDHAIVVRTSPADGARDIFCGDVRRGT
ncbi:hypothetical protein D1Y85_16305 [Paraburkholderia dinghuensis]|uniref:Uncharacterized protein n=2 Tax=Paraburkholderia dinghuensis TaxID=2305225 RepID=A0A3N6MTA5_9BURK|nr:hypothetical protein D1Y85_16305 [Paraburkholderia dinghuensis]